MRITLIISIISHLLFSQVLLDINSIPSGSTVRLNGASIGETPILAFKVTPGNYTLHISSGEYAPVTHELFVQDVKRVKIKFVLNPLYKVKFRSKDQGLTFELNDEHSWVDNRIKLILESGKHTLRVYENGHLFDKQIIQVNRNMEFVYSRQKPQQNEILIEENNID
jgi:hypothetical protein